MGIIRNYHVTQPTQFLAFPCDLTNGEYSLDISTHTLRSSALAHFDR